MHEETGAIAIEAPSGVSVVVPALNEEKAVLDTARSLISVMESTGLPYEIIFVNDGSSDQTGALLEGCSLPLRVLHNESNQGYGFALKRGFREASYDTIVITDADGTYPVDAIPNLLREHGSADMVVGARLGPDARIPLIRRPAKYVLTWLASYLAGVEIPDLNSGLRVLRRESLERFIRILPDGYSLTTTITLAFLTNGYRVRYVPIRYYKRIGKSSIRPVRDTLAFFSLIIRTIVYFNPLKVFFPLGLALICLGLTVGVVSTLFSRLADVTMILFVLTGLQIIALGLVADMIDKTRL